LSQLRKRHRIVLRDPDAYYAKKQEVLRGLIEKEKRKKNKYQALLGISGGKDSAYALYLLKEKFGANVLCFTLATDFLAKGARQNVERITKAFGADHLWIKGPSKELFRHFLMKTGRACYACMISIVQPFHELAVKNKIKLIISGYSAMTDGMDPEGTSPWFVRNVVRESADAKVREEGMRLYRESYNYMIDVFSGRLTLLNMGDYFPWDDEAIRAMFKERYGVEFGGEHSDCDLHDLAGLCAVKKYGFTLNMSKWCKYILLGRMTRDEAIKRIENENRTILAQEGSFGESLAQAMKALDVTEDDLLQAFASNDHAYRKGLLNWAVDFYRRNFYA